MRHLLVVSAAVLALAPAAHAATTDRLYLLAAPGNTAYYSSDPFDADGSAATFEQRCDQFLNPSPTRLCQSTHTPIAELDRPLSWSPERPLRFHAELEILDAADDAVVTFFMQQGGTQFETPPAAQIAPGVWEASLASPARTLSAASIASIGVRVRATGPTVGLTLRTRGRSWVDLPEPVEARSVAEMEAAEPAPAAPSTFATNGRAFEFNDRAWSSESFAGDTTQARAFSADVREDATAVYAWVEHDVGPAVHALASGRSPDPRWNTDFPSLTVTANGAPAGDGSGTTRALRDVRAGTKLVLDVSRSPQSQGKPYTVHVVAVHGERTLRTMRWRSSPGYAVKAPLLAACPTAFDPVVLPAGASTLLVTVDESTPKPTDGWALAYDIPGFGAVVCGTGTTDRSHRYVLPRASRTLFFDGRPAGTMPTVSVYDTVLHYEARLTY